MTRTVPSGSDAYVRVGGMRIRVRRSGTGATLLLVNGIGAPLEMWTPMLERLDDREVVMLDLPGTGKSSAPSRPMRMRSIARIVATVHERLNLGSVDVLGYSFGGAVAQELAYRWPHHVRRLVLCSTTPGLPAVPPDPVVMALMLTPARYYSRGLGAKIVPRISGGRTRRDPAVLAEGLDMRQVHPPSVLGYAAQLLAATGWSSQRWLRDLTQETLVVHGDEDPLAPLANARRMAAQIPRSRLVVVPGAGHLVLLDEPDRAVPAILDFLGAPGNEAGTGPAD